MIETLYILAALGLAEQVFLVILLAACASLAFKYIPMHPAVRNALVVLGVLGLIIWLLQLFGITNFNFPD